MNWFVIFLATVLLNLVACQQFEKRRSSTVLPGKQNVQVSNKNQGNEKRNPATGRSFPRTKEADVKSFVFKGASELKGRPTHEAQKIQGPIELTEKEKIFFELIGDKVENLNEVTIYQRVVDKYRKNDDVALFSYVNLLLKRYPRSIYCDNALYLQGMLLFSQKKYGESLAAFQKILNLYPQSNKAVSALFAKGVVFKKMNLNKQALQLLSQVINRYPGSPESARAEIEVKLITQR